jgi:hypothetical protein
MKIRLQLTASESDTWDWAQCAAADFWADDDARDDGLHFDDCPVSVAKDGIVEIEAHADVLEDMRYRLGVQLPDMVSEQGGSERMAALQQIKIANRILKKLEVANEA